MHVAQNWRVNAQRYTMAGNHCTHCHNVIFPPRAVCPYCGADQVTVLPRKRFVPSESALATRPHH